MMMMIMRTRIGVGGRGFEAGGIDMMKQIVNRRRMVIGKLVVARLTAIF